MRLAESKIKEAILHPEEEVRRTALGYFSRSHTQDETIMPLVIEAVEKYGRDKAFGILRDADSLPQTEATIKWLAGELTKDWDLEDVGNDNYCTAIALILCKARPDLLKPEYYELPAFPEELQEWMEERLEMAGWDWDTGWTVLEQFGQDVREQGQYTVQDSRRADWIVEALARHPGKGDVILPLLHRRYRGHERNLMEWLEGPLVELAGRMRLEEAVPILVERMQEDDLNLSESCGTALPWIGGDMVVQALADRWHDGNGNFRCGAAEIMEHVHTDLSVQKCLEFLGTEEDDDTKDFLANALLGNFAEEAIEPVREMVLKDDEDLTPDEIDTRYRLVVTSTVMGVTFPEYEQWYKQVVEKNWEWVNKEPNRIRENFGKDDEDFEEEDLEYEDWEEGMVEEDAYDHAPYEPPTPIKREHPITGRNDPCPCGSGKKYKKCCLGKDRPQPEQDIARTFPIGTIALYGPDDERTTKIVASVIKREGADPILERWVGSNVKDNPKVRREIQELFKKYGVKSVAATDRNMGCPHEEGQDFPIGGDCPFCPYWKGKQGSGAKE